MIRYLRNCRILVSKYLKPRGSPVKVDKGLFLIFYRVGCNACKLIIFNDIFLIPASSDHLEESVIQRHVDDQDRPNSRIRLPLPTNWYLHVLHTVADRKRVEHAQVWMVRS